MASPKAKLKQIHQIPGPTGSLLFGSMKEFRNDPLSFLHDCVKQYGDAIRIRIGPKLGGRTLFLFNRPEYARQILVDRSKYFKKSPGYQKVRALLGDGLFTSQNEIWFPHRRIIQPLFAKSELERFFPAKVVAITNLLDRWQRIYQDSDSPKINLAAEMNRFALEIVGGTLFGEDISYRAKEIEDPLTIAGEIVDHRMRSAFSPPETWPTQNNKTFKEALGKLHTIVDQYTEKCIQNEPTNPTLLKLLRDARDEDGKGKLSPDEIRDQAMTFLLAGHETSAYALTWTWYLLSQHPEILQKLQTEVDSVLVDGIVQWDSLPQLVYTRMVLEESMRLYPPSWSLGRTNLEDEQLGPWNIPAGNILLLSPFIMQRTPEFWDDPEKFDPERFSEENRKTIIPGSYFPFGLGPRQCIGMEFAMNEMVAALAMIARRFKLELQENFELKIKARLTIRPENDMWMKLMVRDG